MTPSSYAHGQFCWVDLVAHDMTASADFYAELFGWTVEDQDDGDDMPYALFFQGDDVVAGIGEMSDEMRDDGVPPTWNSYISVGDVEAAVEAAEELGATVVTPPMQIMEAGRLAYIQDPTGATVAFWEPGEHHGATRVNEPGTFCWNELNTRDAETAQGFFHDLLGWTYEEDTSSESSYYIIHNEDRSNGGILQMTEEWDDMPPSWMVYFAVEDLDRTVGRLQDLGGTLHHGPFETPVGPMAVVADPEGAPFQLIEMDGEAA